MAQVISKTGQKNNRFGTWTDAVGYKAGDTVVYEGSIYAANSDIPPGTSFLEGTVGATWTQIVEGGGTISEIGAGTPGNVMVDANGVVTISAAGTANVVTVAANGMSLLGNLTLTGPEALVIPGSPGEGSVLTTNANGQFEWSTLAEAVGNSIATDGLTTTGNITTTGVITSNTVTVGETLEVTGDVTAGSNVIVEGNITSNSTVSGNAINSNTTITANGNITSNATVSANALVGNSLTITGNTNLGNVANLTILGGANGQFLQTDGTGNLTWANAGGAISNGTSGITTNTSNVTMAVDGNTIQVIDANGTTTTGNANVTGNITATETITGNTIVSNVANIVTLNITGDANLGDAANLTILGGNAGEVLTTDGTGNVYWATGGSSNGNSGITTNTSNVTMVVGGNTIQLVDANGTTTTGNANVTGNTNVTGNVTAGNITSNGTVTTETLYSNTTIMANGNIMSNGAVIGNILQGNTANIAGNLTAGNITSNGTVTSNVVVANTFTGGNIAGDGAGLTNITGANVVGDVPSALIANFANFAGNVTVAAQPNITSVGTLTGLSVGGDIIPDADEAYDLGNATHKFRDLWLSGATLRLGNSSLSSANGNIVMSSIVANTVNANLFNGNGSGLTNINGANVIGVVPTSNFANFAGNVTVNAQPNITSVGTLTGLTVNGTSTLGPNANVKITGGTSGQLLATDGAGNLIWTTVSTSGASNGTSGTQVNASNVTTVVGGNVIEVIDASGTTITGNANVSGNVNAGNVTTTGNVTANGITSNTANIAGNVTAGNVTTTGNVTANYFVGNGSQLTAINGANITGTVANANYAAYAGNVTIAAQANITSVGTLTSLTVAGNSTLGSNANVRITGGTNGQALFTDGAGNLNWTTITANAIFSGNSNVSIPAANGNVNISAAGNANVVVVTGNGLNVTGTTTLSNGLTIAGGGASITGDLGVNGNLNVIGNVNYNNVAQLVIGDPLIFIASNNATDVVDSGLVSTYNSNKYTGVVRNRTTSTWTVFDNLNTIPVSTIDWANAPLGKFAAGNTTVTGLTANGNVTLGNVANVHIAGGTSGQLLSTDGTGTLSWVSVSGGANFIANGVSNLQFTGSGGNLIGAVDGTANSFFLSPTVFSAKSLSVLLGAGNASTMTPGVDYRVAVGYQAGDSSQATNTVAVGNAAGKSSQSANAVAIGSSAGQTSQSAGAVAIGRDAGRLNQSANTVAIGVLAGSSSQGVNSVAIGTGAGATSQHANTIVLNATGANLETTAANSLYVAPVRNATASNAVYYDPATKEITYGLLPAIDASRISNGTSEFKITGANGNIEGSIDGNNVMRIESGYTGTAKLTIGQNAESSDIRATVVGHFSGASWSTVVLGSSAGNTQSRSAVHVGYGSGSRNNGGNSVTVGANAGTNTTNGGMVIIGSENGRANPGANSISIGNHAVANNSGNSSIVLNASGTAITAAANSFYVNPIRNATVANTVFYDPVTKEVTYGVASAGEATSIANGTSNIGFAGANGGYVGYIGGALALSMPQGFGLNSGRTILGVNANGASGTTSIGSGAGSGNPSSGVFVGFAAGSLWSASNIVVIGANAGGGSGGDGAIVIGQRASFNQNLGINSIVIGNAALSGGTPANTIVLNASGTGIAPTGTANSFYVAPVRNATASNVVYYDPATKEMTYGTVGVATGANFANFAGNITVAAQPNITSVGTLTSVTVSGVANLGTVANVKIAGGSTSQVLSTDGAGNLSWVSVSAAASANFANFAGNVTVAAQPNITSVGTLTSLTVTGNINATGANVSLGAVGNVKITGGTTGQFLRTDGAGTLTWAGTPTPSLITDGSLSNVGFGSGGSITGYVNTAPALILTPNAVSLGGSAASLANGVAIGYRATAQSNTVAIGANAALNTTSVPESVIIGSQAGMNVVSGNSVIIGSTSGFGAAGNGVVIIGSYSAQNAAGATSIAIGHKAVANSSGNNSVVLNATGTAITASANSLYVAPIRNSTAANAVFYDPTTKEMTYGAATSGAATFIANGTSNVGFSGTDSGIIGYVGGAPAISMPSGFSAKTILGVNANAGDATTSVGVGAGSGSGADSVYVGRGAGALWSNASIVAIGCNIGGGGAGSGAIVIGQRAAFNQNLGINSIVIGNAALNGGTAANTIVLNASGTGITSAGATPNSFYVNPVRNATAGNVVYYDITTKEMTYGVAGAATSIASSSSNLAFTGANSNITGFVNTGRHLELSFWQTYVGRLAGANSANQQTIGVGINAGRLNQQLNGIGIGTGAAEYNQGDGAIALGTVAGQTSQSGNAIAIGYNAGTNAQGAYSIAIGFNAGNTTQGAGAIAIGLNAGLTSQHANSIIISAAGTLNSAAANSFYVNPVRNATAANVVYYDPTTKEMTYGVVTSATPTTIVNGTSSVFMDGTNGNVITKVGGTNTLKVDSTNGLTVLVGGISMAGPANFGPVNETFYSMTGATGVVDHSCSTGQIFNHTSIASNFTVNLTNLSVATGYATVITLMLNQGATAYVPNALQIAGTAQTIKWQGGTVPTGNANKLDAVAFTIFRTAASTYVVTGQMVSYG